MRGRTRRERERENQRDDDGESENDFHDKGLMCIRGFRVALDCAGGRGGIMCIINDEYPRRQLRPRIRQFRPTAISALSMRWIRCRTHYGRLRQFYSRDQCVSDLAEQIRKRVRRMRNQDRVGVIVRRDFLQRVEILGHQHQLHYVLRRRTRHSLGKIFHRIFQPGNNGFALIRDCLLYTSRCV